MMNRLSLALLLLGVGAPGMMFGMEEAKSDDETTQNQGEKSVFPEEVKAYFKEMFKRKELRSKLQWTRDQIKLLGWLKDNASTYIYEDEVALGLEIFLRKEADLIAQLESRGLDPEEIDAEDIDVRLLAPLIIATYLRNKYAKARTTSSSKCFGKI